MLDLEKANPLPPLGSILIEMLQLMDAEDLKGQYGCLYQDVERYVARRANTVLRRAINDIATWGRRASPQMRRDALGIAKEYLS